MTMTERSTVVGVFMDRAAAERAISDLRTRGFTDDQIGYVVRHAGTTEGNVSPEGGRSEAAERTAIGAAGGGVAGGIIGAAASLLIPGFGPALAGGILAATLGGAVVGAAAGGIIGALTSMGVPEEEARYYQGEFEAGRVIVTVKATGRQNEAQNVLRQYGAYDAYTRPGTYDTTTGSEYNPAMRRPDYRPDEPRL
jgi:hypothetical protein